MKYISTETINRKIYLFYCGVITLPYSNIVNVCLFDRTEIVEVGDPKIWSSSMLLGTPKSRAGTPSSRIGTQSNMPDSPVSTKKSSKAPARHQFPTCQCCQHTKPYMALYI